MLLEERVENGKDILTHERWIFHDQKAKHLRHAQPSINKSTQVLKPCPDEEVSKPPCHSPFRINDEAL